MTRLPAFRSRARLLAAALAFAAAGAAATAVAAPADAASALRHLRLERAEPAADTVLAAAPTHVRLWFSQRPELKVTSIRLAGPAGDVKLGTLSRAEAAKAPIVAAVEGAMAPGAYTVTWRTMASDGHVLNGTVKFRLAGDAAR